MWTRFSGKVSAGGGGVMWLGLLTTIARASITVQVHGRNGVEIPLFGWCLPAEGDEEVWKSLRHYSQSNKFVIGEVQFEITRNPVYQSDRAMAESIRAWAGVPEKEPLENARSEMLVDLPDALESAEEASALDAEADLLRLGVLPAVRVPSVPREGFNGLVDPDVAVIAEDLGQLDLLSLIATYPPPFTPCEDPTQPQMWKEVEVQQAPRAPRARSAANNLPLGGFAASSGLAAAGGLPVRRVPTGGAGSDVQGAANAQAVRRQSSGAAGEQLVLRPEFAAARLVAARLEAASAAQRARHEAFGALVPPYVSGCGRVGRCCADARMAQEGTGAITRYDYALPPPVVAPRPAAQPASTLPVKGKGGTLRVTHK